MIKKIKSIIIKRKFNKLSKGIITQCTWTKKELEEYINSTSSTLTFFDEFMCPCSIKKEKVVDFYNSLTEIVTYGITAKTMYLLENFDKRVLGIVNPDLRYSIHNLKKL